ncbi:ABC transporter substrate-binding protein [Sulfobacillus thermotolerans]|uniref:ABC transporter substrate-binding protein n=1 Tax=Sulfobacillus thermotolerans TaxID=338644 RepID=UPI0033693EB7
MKKVLPLALIASLGVLAAGCGASPTHSAAAQTFTTIDEAHGITDGAPMNPFNTNGNSFMSFDVMQLGWFTNSATNPNDFYPGLAKKWQISDGGRTVTVWLQPNAKWSNGQPVTAQDVKASMAAGFTQGNSQAFYLGSVKVISPTEVQFTQVPGQNYNLFFNSLMQQPIIPAFEYDPIMGKNIWTIIDESMYTGSNPALKALATKAQTELTNIGKSVVDYAPKTDISAGPFLIKNLNPGEALLVKNPDFYAANKIHIKQVVFRNYTGNQRQLVYYPYSNKTEGNWVDSPQEIPLPNGKMVNPGQLTYDLNSLTAAQQRPIVQKLALATNESLPMITLWNYINVQFINTTRFTDFPVHNNGMLDNPPGVWIMSGYVQPK